MKIKATKNLTIELTPSHEAGEPLLRLTATDAPGQSVIIFLNEVQELREALAEAGAELAEIEVEGRGRRN